MEATTTLDGIEVFTGGEGDDAIVMIHGWPDTHRLWDGTVAALQDRFRCVRFTLPGFDIDRPSRPTSVAAMVELIRKIVEEGGGGRPVTLLLHDWGCVFGYQFAMSHPALVSRLIGIDVGDAGSREFKRGLTAKAKAMIAGYQLWLALAWRLGGTLGDRMTRAMARWLRCPADPAHVGAQMNYPYAMQWLGTAGGMRGLAPLEPRCPMLFFYGTRKPFLFHTSAWALVLAARPGCRVQPMRTGHWVMLDDPEGFNRALRDWLLPGTR
ncbi:MAG: alpha/beta fold hydrolase [Burkholderiales bacterium]|nr:alpha/beta fold hydrolase [Burkholderiales bacterium]